MNTRLFFKFVKSVIKGRKYPIGSKTFIRVVLIIFDLIGVAHHHGFSIVLFDLVIVLHFVHADDLPVVTRPKHSMQRAQQYLDVIFLTGHKSTIWILATNPGVDLGSELELGLVPLILDFFLGGEILLDVLLDCRLMLCLGRGSKIWLLLRRLLGTSAKIEITEPSGKLIFFVSSILHVNLGWIIENVERPWPCRLLIFKATAEKVGLGRRLVCWLLRFIVGKQVGVLLPVVGGWRLVRRLRWFVRKIFLRLGPLLLVFVLRPWSLGLFVLVVVAKIEALRPGLGLLLSLWDLVGLAAHKLLAHAAEQATHLLGGLAKVAHALFCSLDAFLGHLLHFLLMICHFYRWFSLDLLLEIIGFLRCLLATEEPGDKAVRWWSPYALVVDQVQLQLVQAWKLLFAGLFRHNQNFQLDFVLVDWCWHLFKGGEISWHYVFENNDFSLSQLIINACFKSKKQVAVSYRFFIFLADRAKRKRSDNICDINVTDWGVPLW